MYTEEFFQIFSVGASKTMYDTTNPNADPMNKTAPRIIKGVLKILESPTPAILKKIPINIRSNPKITTLINKLNKP